ncbi:HIT domain-containing protein [Mangrovicella endophytica]|uniref:HIT domain-containing protein n=1 Tax=Mangrovicella endophytica TaxID=2066697 RepID=UPI000C9EA00E|nr:HIT family protein [Mangrovicella endophytica]
MRAFELDPRLTRDTFAVGRLGLCELRLMNDRRWPWLILVPQRNDVVEFHELTPLDQTMLTFEVSLVAPVLKRITRADKLNIGTLGNVVSMFHLHIVARSAGDANWPGPVWGHGSAIPYGEMEASELLERVREAVLSA